MNGIANPKEYKINKKIAFPKVSSIAANARIDPKIGPIHGVHPKPNAIPTNIELKIPDFFSV